MKKPVHSFFVNAGIYVLSPQVLNLIPEDTHYDMTQVLGKLIEEDSKVNPFLLREYWLDIGKKEDFERAGLEFLGDSK